MLDLDAIDDRAQQGYPASCLETLDMTAEIRRLRELCGEAADAVDMDYGGCSDTLQERLREAASKGEL